MVCDIVTFAGSSFRVVSVKCNSGCQFQICIESHRSSCVAWCQRPSKTYSRYSPLPRLTAHEDGIAHRISRHCAALDVFAPHQHEGPLHNDVAISMRHLVTVRRVSSSYGCARVCSFFHLPHSVPLKVNVISRRSLEWTRSRGRRVRAS